MAKFYGSKNLHIGDDVHAVPHDEGRGYVIEVSAAKAKALKDYLASEGFTPDDAPDAD